MNFLPILAGGLHAKLYQGDPLAFFLAKPFIFAGLVFALGFCTFVVLNYHCNKQDGKRGWISRRGITGFRGVILGDSILLPLMALSQGLFYQKASLENADSWLLYDWIPWICIGAAFLWSFQWVNGAMNSRPGDWTTVSPTRSNRGGINIYGLIHWVFYVGVVSTWITFGVKSFGYLITVDHPANLIGIEILAVVAVVDFIGLLLWDFKSIPHWPWE